MYRFLPSITVAALVVALALGANYALAASTWSGASANPPGNNVDAPINTSTTAQNKEGALKIGSLDTIEDTAVLELDSITQGFLPPRLTTSQRDAIVADANDEGLVIYNTDSDALETWNGVTWHSLATSTPQGGGGGGGESGQVAFFDLASCPSGWTEYTNSRGRYVVGLNSGGTLGSTIGTALTDQQNAAAGAHGHGVGNVMGLLGYGAAAGFPSNPIWSWTSGATFSTYSVVGGQTISSGTNAPYIQLLACKKD